MKFSAHQFSKRFSPVDCSIFVIHDDVHTKYRGTAAAIILPSGAVYIGTSVCSPGDQFVKKVGRAKAIGRAFQAMRKEKREMAISSAHLADDKAIEIVTTLLRFRLDERKKDCGVYA